MRIFYVVVYFILMLVALIISPIGFWLLKEYIEKRNIGWYLKNLAGLVSITWFFLFALSSVGENNMEEFLGLTVLGFFPVYLWSFAIIVWVQRQIEIGKKIISEQINELGLHEYNDVLITENGYISVQGHIPCKMLKLLGDINPQTGEAGERMYMAQYDIADDGKYRFKEDDCKILFPAPEYVSASSFRPYSIQTRRATNLGEEYRKVQEYRKQMMKKQENEI